ncbi:MAG: DUF2782 domain-containing protein [Sedimenticolaceae bacterium]
MLHKTKKGHGRVAVTGLLMLAGAAIAEDRQTVESPPLPPQLRSGDPLEPQVTIRRTKQEVIHEYRQNGKLIMVRVQPRVGPAYHFVDTDGDGSLDYQPGEPVHNNINQWVLWRW